jgi:hypothetical protein
MEIDESPEVWSPYKNSDGSPLVVVQVGKTPVEEVSKAKYFPPPAIQAQGKKARRSNRLWTYSVPLLALVAILWAVFGELGYSLIPLSWHTPEGRKLIEAQTRTTPRVPTSTPSPAVGETFASSPEAALVVAPGNKASALFLNPNGIEAPPLDSRIFRGKLVLADDVILDPTLRPFLVVNPGSHLVPITHTRAFPQINTALLEVSFDPKEWVGWLGSKPWIDPMSVPAAYRIQWRGKVVSKSKPLNLTLAIPIVYKGQRTLFLVSEKQTFINAM